MLLGILCVIAAALVLGDFIYRYLETTQILKRGKLQHPEKARPDAVITGREPKVAGAKRTRHYIYVVTFSDGTVYQDVCGVRDPRLGRHGMRFDEARAEEIVQKAAEAHRAAAEGSRQP